MSAADDVLFALEKQCRREPDPKAAAIELLAKYDAEVLAAANTHGRLRDFTPVWTTSDGTRIPATELACVLCDGLVQGVGPHTLLDLTELADQHNCQKGGAS